jgi:NADH-quinone oxidoreductase subunit G
MRILPRTNDAVNEEWISDKTRHITDGLKRQRLDRPYVRRNGTLVPATWTQAFAAVAARLKAAAPARIGAIAGDLAAVEEMFALKLLMQGLDVTNLDCRQDGAMLDPALGRASYLFNATVEGIESADALLIVGANPRKEAAVLNARIRKRWRMGGFPVGLVGERADLTYSFDWLGAGAETLADIAASNGFGAVLAKAERPLIIVGQGALRRPDGRAVLSLAARIASSAAVAEGWNGLCVLHTAAARVGGLDIGFVPGEGGLAAPAMAAPGALDLLFLLGADEIEVAPGAFVVYIGTHGDRGAHRADVILPAATYTEKSGTYVNTEGRVQFGQRAAFPPGDAREDWAVLRALSDVLGSRLPFDSLAALRAMLYAAHPHLAQIDAIAPSDASAVKALGDIGGALGNEPFVAAIGDFYLTNPIARASAVMAECSALAAGDTMLQAAE